MSLYVYLVEATPEQAKAWDEYVAHARTVSIFGTHRCWRENCMPEGISLEGGVCLGRPLCNDFAAGMERWYGSQTLGENVFTAALMVGAQGAKEGSEGPNRAEVDAWVKARIGKTVLIVNDNEI